MGWPAALRFLNTPYFQNSKRYGVGVALSWLVMLLMLLHSMGVAPIHVVHVLDDMWYDARLRAMMPNTLDERIVIVDIDERSLQRMGHWPWSRNKLAQLTTTLLQHYKVNVLGFDVLFSEADTSSGLTQLQQMSQGALQDVPEFQQQWQLLRHQLDYDAQFAQALQRGKTVLGYYFSSDREGLTKGVLPMPVMDGREPGFVPLRVLHWDGFGANIEPLTRAASTAGFFNSVTDDDGIVRSLPLLAVHEQQYYESLSLAVFRQVKGLSAVRPERIHASGSQGQPVALNALVLQAMGTQPAESVRIPLDQNGTMLVPFRGPGGAWGGSFRYVSAVDVLQKKVPLEWLQQRIVLMGATAPGLLDLRATPVGQVYPGVEVHANAISGLLDGRIFARPDYSQGYEWVMLLCMGVFLGLYLPRLDFLRSALCCSGVLVACVALNLYLYEVEHLVVPVASSLWLVGLTFVVNTSYGYLTENRTKNQLVNLFGSYVHPELVKQMLQDPDRYSMQAIDRELTIMFCDMRGFTHMAENLPSHELQTLLKDLFSRLTRAITRHQGTIDKYMGDCVMAFWGAPVPLQAHASHALNAALECVKEVHKLNRQRRRQGLPALNIGIGLNTGMVHVGDMGSDVRRSYTAIGDAVNLAARLEGLSKLYGVPIIVSEFTRRHVQRQLQQHEHLVWQELDWVRVKGKDSAVRLFTPLDRNSPGVTRELRAWELALQAYRTQDWDRCNVLLSQLLRMRPEKQLYAEYAQRVLHWMQQAPPTHWDAVMDVAATEGSNMG